jgi:hypothetical protein
MMLFPNGWEQTEWPPKRLSLMLNRQAYQHQKDLRSLAHSVGLFILVYPILSVKAIWFDL